MKGTNLSVWFHPRLIWKFDLFDDTSPTTCVVRLHVTEKDDDKHECRVHMEERKNCWSIWLEELKEPSHDFMHKRAGVDFYTLYKSLCYIKVTVIQTCLDPRIQMRSGAEEARWTMVPVTNVGPNHLRTLHKYLNIFNTYLYIIFLSFINHVSAF